MTFLSTVASVAMAVGPPMVYIDQFRSILKRKDSTGFSHDACGVILVANILRIFFWFGKRFEIALLAQSIIMIVFQLVLLYACIAYKPALPLSAETALEVGTKQPWYRPYNLWGWTSYGTYIEFIAGLIAVNTLIYLFLGGFALYVEVMGLLALSIDAVLPIPQLLSNWQRKSLAGFRLTVLAGWIFGDAFKTIYYFVQEGNSWQFKVTACFQLSVDFLILAQAFIYRGNTARSNVAYINPESQVDLADPDSISRSHSVEMR